MRNAAWWLVMMFVAAQWAIQKCQASPCAALTSGTLPDTSLQGVSSLRLVPAPGLVVAHVFVITGDSGDAQVRWTARVASSTPSLSALAEQRGTELAISLSLTASSSSSALYAPSPLMTSLVLASTSLSPRRDLVAAIMCLFSTSVLTASAQCAASSVNVTVQMPAGTTLIPAEAGEMNYTVVTTPLHAPTPTPPPPSPPSPPPSNAPSAPLSTRVPLASPTASPVISFGAAANTNFVFAGCVDARPLALASQPFSSSQCALSISLNDHAQTLDTTCLLSFSAMSLAFCAQAFPAASHLLLVNASLCVPVFSDAFAPVLAALTTCADCCQGRCSGNPATSCGALSPNDFGAWISAYARASTSAPLPPPSPTLAQTTAPSVKQTAAPSARPTSRVPTQRPETTAPSLPPALKTPAPSTASPSQRPGAAFACSTGRADCNFATMTNDGCECATPACCSNGACQITHSNGAGALFYDCVAKGVVTVTQAMSACAASGALFCSNDWSCAQEPNNLFVCDSPTGALDTCAKQCWGYNGTFAGAVTACSPCDVKTGSWN